VSERMRPAGATPLNNRIASLTSLRTNRGRKIPEVLTAIEQEALLAQSNSRYLTGHRNGVMLCLMLDTGLRLSEVINLHWRDIDLNTGKVIVRQGKGRKDRTLWTGDANLAALQAWREHQTRECTRSPEYVFTTKQGGRLHPRYVQRMVKRYASKAGIEKNITPHTLRHTFATDLYRETTNIRLTQKTLGHANLATTQIYTHIVDEELKEALKSFRCSDNHDANLIESSWVSSAAFCSSIIRRKSSHAALRLACTRSDSFARLESSEALLPISHSASRPVGAELSGYERHATMRTANHENINPRMNQIPPPRSLALPRDPAITAGNSIRSRTIQKMFIALYRPHLIPQALGRNTLL